MCIISAVGDYYDDRWKAKPFTSTKTIQYTLGVSREEFDALKAEVEEMKELLRMAKILDEKLGQPDCEMEEKIATLKKVAELVGVSLDDIFSA